MPPSSASLEIVFIGLAITSSWGNGHATTYRSLIKGLGLHGHRVTFLEKDQPWYAEYRDQPTSEFCQTSLYENLEDLQSRFATKIRQADAVIVGSYTDDGRRVIDWVLSEARGVRCFYDIDTPVTLRALASDESKYLGAEQIADFDVMLSFTGGPTLETLQNEYGAKRAAALYCSVDLDHYRPQSVQPQLALAYMGTYSDDRQPGVEALLNEPARALLEQQFMVVGAQYPKNIAWPKNVQHREHLPPSGHAQFYASQRFTLNITRADMRKAGYSPSVRLFEAAACGTPIISDDWPGLSEIFKPTDEIVIAHASSDVIECLRGMSDAERNRLATNARARTIAEHSSTCRAQQLEQYILEATLPTIRQHGTEREMRAAG